MTALALTPNPATGSVLLEITGAPSPGPAVYTGNAEASIDGWAAAGTPLPQVGRDPGVIAGSWSFYVDFQAGTAAGAAYAQRTLTGLTVGERYRASMQAHVSAAAPHIAVAVSGLGQGTPTTSREIPQRITYEFIATATSHVLRVVPVAAAGSYATVWFDTITVEPVPDETTTITRTDANGTGPVRLLEGQEPNSGVLTVEDYEPAFTGPLRYDVVDGDGVTTTATTALDGLVTGPWLGVPVLPQLGRAVDRVLDFNSTQANTGTVHDIAGRGDPVVTLGPLGTRRGTLEVWAPDHATARLIEGVYGRGEVVHLRQPDHAGLDCYHVATGVRIRPAGAATAQHRWLVTVDYVEVATPTAPLQGALGWSFADVTARYPDFAAVAAAYPDFAALTIGPA